MQFCKDCGGVLNFFGNNETDLCSACIQHQKRLDQKKDPKPAAPPPETLPDFPAEAALSLEEGRIVLRSKEGWELWSSPGGAPTALSTMLARARRIYEIRLRRQKN